MKTKYIDIIELVLLLLKSYEIDGIFDQYKEEGLLTYLKPYFKVAAGELKIHGSQINTERDDNTNTFTTALSDEEQLVFAKFILIAYLTKDTLDILAMKNHLQDGDFKTHAAKNLLDAKLNALIVLKEEVGWNINKIGYNSMNVWCL